LGEHFRHLVLQLMDFSHPLISIDGTHLYGMYKKKLLVTVVDNVNNEVYSLFSAIVEEETNNN